MAKRSRLRIYNYLFVYLRNGLPPCGKVYILDDNRRRIAAALIAWMLEVAHFTVRCRVLYIPTGCVYLAYFIIHLFLVESLVLSSSSSFIIFFVEGSPIAPSRLLHCRRGRPEAWPPVAWIIFLSARALASTRTHTPHRSRLVCWREYFSTP